MKKAKLRRKLREARKDTEWLRFSIEHFWKPEERDWLKLNDQLSSRNGELEAQVRKLDGALKLANENTRRRGEHRDQLDRNITEVYLPKIGELGDRLRAETERAEHLYQWSIGAAMALDAASVISARGDGHVNYGNHDRLLRELRELTGYHPRG